MLFFVEKIHFLCNFTHFLYNFIFLCKSLFFCRWARQICVIVTDMSTLFGDDFLTFGIVEFGIVSTFVEVNRGKFEVVANVVLLEYLPQLCNVCAWFPAAMFAYYREFKSSFAITTGCSTFSYFLFNFGALYLWYLFFKSFTSFTIFRW